MRGRDLFSGGRNGEGKRGRREPKRLPEPVAGAELDRLVGIRVFRHLPPGSVPAFSTSDWTATALAELVVRRAGWVFDAFERNGRWWVTWSREQKPPSRAISGFVTSTAPTWALAICRGLLRATETRDWLPLDFFAGSAGGPRENDRASFSDQPPRGPSAPVRGARKSPE
jgi:hypothetical protein